MTFDEFKKKIKCEWEVQKEINSSAHAIRTIEKGICKNKNIVYEFPSGPNAYEVRWKK